MMVVMKSLLVFGLMLFASSFASAQIPSLDSEQLQAETVTWRKIETGQPLTVGFIEHMGGSILRARTSEVLLRSADMGETWQVIPDLWGGDTTLAGQQFFNDSLGYVASNSSPWLYKTTNGGQTWDSKTHTLTASGLDGFIMFDTTRGLAWSSVQTAQTQDAGKWWLVRSTGGSVNDVDFADPKHGFAVGDPHPWEIDPPVPNAAHFSRTSDGGRNWEDVYPGWPNVWWMIQALSPQRLLALADRYVFISTNAGDSWTPQVQVTAPQHYHALHRDKNSNLYLCGNFGLLMRSVDSGKSWVRIEVPISGSIVYATFIDSLTGFFSGPEGLYKTTTGGKSWVESKIERYNTEIRIRPNPAQVFSSIEFTLGATERISIVIYDMSGKAVLTPVANEMLPEGSNVIRIATDKMRTGTYRLVLTGDESRGETQMTIVR
jgi:photosystem II stability/assembly factor-like uncharacterized protein